ncbi:MAG TPA: HepT-like ribonuclease domain-containing protein [Planctomycetota bacterium]|nr:HepT-like ribonuclease domain-containing protein [Planctomycetota bacterium]
MNAAAGWLTPAMCDTCRRMVSFRNIVVHQYLQVDVRILEQILARDLDDLLAVVRVIRDRLSIR